MKNGPVIWMLIAAILIICATASVYFALEKFTPTPSKMCIFDIDNTLTHGADAEKGGCPDAQFLDDPEPAWPAGGGTTKTVKDIIRRCREKGYGIAIATAESKDEYDSKKQRDFLNALGFDSKLLKTPNFQQSCSVITSNDNGQLWCKTNEFSDKTAMYINIMNHNNIPPSQWKSSIVFDDDLGNLTTAKSLGFQVCQASPQCGGKYCSRGCGMPRGCLDVLR